MAYVCKLHVARPLNMFTNAQFSWLVVTGLEQLHDLHLSITLSSFHKSRLLGKFLTFHATCFLQWAWQSWFERAMSLADSEAAFGQHCNKIVTDGSLLNLLQSKGIRNLSALAFSISTPQVPPSDEQFKDFTTRPNDGWTWTLVHRPHSDGFTLRL